MGRSITFLPRLSEKRQIPRLIACTCASIMLASCGQGLPERVDIYAVHNMAPHTQVKSIVAGANGRIIVVANDLTTNRDTLVQLSPDGSMQPMPVDGDWQQIAGIASAPDGAVWFVASDTTRHRFQVVRYDSHDARTSTIRISGAAADIAVGNDGSAWVAETSADEIGHVTPDGRITEYRIPPGKSVRHSGPWGIAVDPKGNAWFTLTWADAIGRMTPEGRIAEFAVRSRNSRPLGISLGPDGNMWFTELTANKLGRITPSGTETEFSSPSVRDNPSAITPGRDDDLWFCEVGTVGRITTAGVIATRLAPLGTCGGIAVDGSGEVWFTQQIPPAGFSGPERTAVATLSESDWSSSVAKAQR